MSNEGADLVERVIETRIHGRYLLSPGRTAGSPLLLGFHGYGETADEHLRRLRSIPAADRWTIVSIQGLHQFYRRRTNEVVASWMTRQNREFAIADNIAYVSGVVRELVLDNSPGTTVVTCGFSQGVAMAYRAAVTLGVKGVGVLACGGDLPPELDAGALSRIGVVLVGRGLRDEWYTEEKLAADETRLRAAGVQTTTLRFDAGHEWPAAFSQACSGLLESSLARNMTL
jgi:predicted esterase